MAHDPKGSLDFEAPIAELERKIEELESFATTTEMDLQGQIEQLRARCREAVHRLGVLLPERRRPV